MNDYPSKGDLEFWIWTAKWRIRCLKKELKEEYEHVENCKQILDKRYGKD